MLDTTTSMLTFEQFPYERPEMQETVQAFERHLHDFEQATSASEQTRALQRLNEVRERFQTMYSLCYIRHTADTRDKFYEQENAYFDENLPTYEALNNRFYRCLLQSRFRSELEAEFGSQMFVLAELALKTFQPSILEELQRENALSTEYAKLKAQALIELDGTTYNLSSLGAVEESPDRDKRERAAEAKWAFFAQNAPAVEGIFDEMVKVRHRLAQELGYSNFIGVGYARMRRSDYTPEMVAEFRRQVRDVIVPIANELYERQRKRLGLDTLYFYDEEYEFPSGNPLPIGTPEEIIHNAGKMYQELSAETDTFFNLLRETHLMDLVNRDGKVTGGYCTYLSEFKAPFIFSNFNGTSSDINVLTHEAGHAFQVWLSGSFAFDEYHWPTSDAAEIHSMSMEFFTWPWMSLFFGEQTEKFCFTHLAGAIRFLPYGVAVDEFQHIIYANPDMTPAERNAAWKDLERIYLPHRNYAGNTFLENGGFWQKQSHIFSSPFYYIDYTLAQICAFQFWMRDRQQHEPAWRDYLNLCKAGGSKSFLDLVKLANLDSPFEDGCVERVAGEIRAYLNSIDDSAW